MQKPDTQAVFLITYSDQNADTKQEVHKKVATNFILTYKMHEIGIAIVCSA